MESNILRIIRKKQKEISDKEVFTSLRMEDYLCQKADKVHQHFHIPSSLLRIIYEETNDLSACTDNANYLINAGCNLVKGTRQQKLDIICGLLLHEIGHRIFSSSTTLNMAKNSLLSAKVSFLPPVLSSFQQTQKEDLEIHLENVHENRMFLKIYQCLWNVMEDARIEYLLLSYCKRFSVLHNGLKIMRDRVYEDVPSYPVMRETYEDETKKLQTLMQALLSYALYGELKELDYEASKFDNLLLDLEPCLQYADECIEATSDVVFFQNLSCIVLELWPFIKQELERLSNENEDEETQEQSLSELLDAIEGMLNEQVQVSRPAAEERNLQQMLGDKNNENPPVHNIPFTRNVDISAPADGTGKTSYRTETPNSLLSSVEKELAETKVIQMQQDEMEKLIDEAKNCIDFGEIHENIDCEIIRQKVTSYARERYLELSPPLTDIAKKMAKKSDFFSEEENPVTFRNRYYGTRFHAETIARKDFRNFSQKVNLEEAPSLSVGVVIDESGSMGGQKCQVARKMAIMLYEYCELMDVSLSIYGHSTNGSAVTLYPYTDFEQNFPDDKFRLANISSRNSNRDGYALRFMYHRLIDQPTEYKLLIIVSDGQPAHRDYYGSGAFADLRDIAKMCEKNDVILLAAAIDEDKEEIMTAYGKQHFLDITDLERLPVKMTSIIKSMLK